MKYGVTQWSLPGNGAYAVKYAAEAGLDGLQIELGSHDNGYYMAQKKVQDDYMNDAAKYGVEFPSIVLNDLSFHGFVGAETGEDYAMAINSLALALTAARRMHIGMIMIPQFWANEITNAETFANTVKVMKKYCEDAAAYDIRIGSETTLDADKQIELTQAVNMPNFCTFYDSQNYRFFKGYDQKETLEKLYPYLGDQLHVKDGTGIEHKGGVLSGCLLGKGDSDFQATVDKLKKEGYDGWLILENYYYVKSFRDLNENQFESLKQDADYLRSLFS